MRQCQVFRAESKRRVFHRRGGHCPLCSSEEIKTHRSTAAVEVESGGGRNADRQETVIFSDVLYCEGVAWPIYRMSVARQIRSGTELFPFGTNCALPTSSCTRAFALIALILLHNLCTLTACTPPRKTPFPTQLNFTLTGIPLCGFAAR